MNVQALSDQALLHHYLSGDRSAISQLIERHSRRVRDYINMMVKDRDVAEDIFQETFIKAVRVIDDGRYTDNGKFLSWVLRIAHNQVIDHFRAQKQEKEVNESESGYDMFGTLRLAEGSVEDALVSEQIERGVRALVELLPGETRSCRVTVPDQQLSLAIGNKGQNARLCARLTGYNIDIRPESGYYGEDEEPKAAEPKTEDAE